MAFSIEYEFTLPQGYIDKDGNLHKKGVMRLATAADEILPLKDGRVQSNPAYLTIIVLSRVVKSIGDVDFINTGVIEDLFSSDFAYLQDFYNKINGNEETQDMICPKCGEKIEVDGTSRGK